MGSSGHVTPPFSPSPPFLAQSISDPPSHQLNLLHVADHLSGLAVAQFLASASFAVPLAAQTP